MTRESTVSTLLIGLAAVMFGLVPLFARNLVDAGLDPAVIALYRYAIAAIIMLPFLRLSGVEARATLWGMGCGAMMGLGWIGYVIALKSLPVATVGVLYMTYPLFTVALGALVFGRRIGGRALAGGSLVLGGALVALGPGTAEMPSAWLLSISSRKLSATTRASEPA